MADRVERAALLARRIWIERVFLGFHLSAIAGIWPAAEALHDHALHAAIAGGGKQIVGSAGAQTVAVCEGAITSGRAASTAA
jgi:hypothetical protein